MRFRRTLMLHAALLRFHNRIAKLLDARREDFRIVQRLVRWHCQWVMLNDFLPTIIGEETLNSILPHLAKQTSILQDKPNLQFYTWRYELFIPVKCSVAAYRFGHSMVRPIYWLNTTLPEHQVLMAELIAQALQA